MSDSCDPEEGFPDPSEPRSQSFDDFCDAMFSQVAAATGVGVADLLSRIDPKAEREGAGEAIRAGMIEVSASNEGSDAAPLPVGAEWRDVMRDRFSKEKVAVSPPRYLRQILRELWMAVRRQ